MAEDASEGVRCPAAGAGTQAKERTGVTSEPGAVVRHCDTRCRRRSLRRDRCILIGLVPSLEADRGHATGHHRPWSRLHTVTVRRGSGWLKRLAPLCQWPWYSRIRVHADRLVSAGVQHVCFAWGVA